MVAACTLSLGCAAPAKLGNQDESGKAGSAATIDSTADQPEASPELRVVFRETCPSGVTPDFRPNAPNKSALGAILIGAASYVVADMVGSTVDTIGKTLSSDQAVTFTDHFRV